MVLVVREALVHLGLRERRQAAPGEAVNGLAVLQKTDDIVHRNPSALHPRVAAPDVRRSNDVSVGLGNVAHREDGKGLGGKNQFDRVGEEIRQRRRKQVVSRCATERPVSVAELSQNPIDLARFGFAFERKQMPRIDKTLGNR